MRREVLALCLLFLLADGHLAQAAALTDSNHKCAIMSMTGLKEFLSPKAGAMPTNHTYQLRINKACKAAPAVFQLLPSSLQKQILDLKPIKFLAQKFREKPEYHAAFVEQHARLLELAQPQSLLQLASDGGDVNACTSDGPCPELIRAARPFWVYHTTDMRNNECALFHFLTYTVSWIGLGGFLWQAFKTSVHYAPSKMNGSLRQMSLAALGSQLLFALTEMTCMRYATGLRYQACTERGRLVWNFVVLFALLFCFCLATHLDTGPLSGPADPEAVAEYARRELEIQRLKRLGSRYYPGDEFASELNEDATAIKEYEKATKFSGWDVDDSNFEKLTKERTRQTKVHEVMSTSETNSNRKFIVALSATFAKSRDAKLALGLTLLTALGWSLSCILNVI